VDRLFEPLTFPRGPVVKNRFMLAPLTNLQSHADGTLSDEEFNWLAMRARGGFGLIMTCATYVQTIGQGFAGQLGLYDDRHIAGLERLASEIRRHGALSMVQLQHSGLRSPPDLIGGTPVSASDDTSTGARALSMPEVEQLVADFVQAAVRAERAGLDGVQLHGAHNYIICQFLSPEMNRRTDRYGGSLENRCRLLWEIAEGIRARCRPDFLVSVRLSAERFGMTLAESPVIAGRLMASGLIDLLDLSLWDVFKQPEDPAFREKSLLEWFSGLERGGARLAAAGKVHSVRDANRVLACGVDLAEIGRGAILHHDFPERCRDDPFFEPVELPVTPDYLRSEGVSDNFIGYMRNWEGFVTD